MESSALMFALTTFLLWGTTNFLISYGEKHTDIQPATFTAVMWVSMGVMGLILMVYLYSTGKTIQIDTRLAYPIAAGVLLGVGILTLSLAMSHTSTGSGATAAVATSNAVFTALLAFAFMDEKLDIKQWIGIGTVILGIVILRI